MKQGFIPLNCLNFPKQRASESLKGAMDGCDVVYHMAGFVAQWSGYNEVLYKVNTLDVRYVLEAAFRVLTLYKTSLCVLFFSMK